MIGNARRKRPKRDHGQSRYKQDSEPEDTEGVIVLAPNLLILTHRQLCGTRFLEKLVPILRSIRCLANYCVHRCGMAHDSLLQNGHADIIYVLYLNLLLVV